MAGGGTPICALGAAMCNCGGTAVGIPSKTLAQGMPVLKGPGSITPHPPAPYDFSHAIGLTMPVRKIFCEGMPVVAVTDKCTCKCVMVTGIPTILVGK
jgi:hypothetical protein